MVKNYEPISRLKRFFYLWRLYRLVNTLLKKRIAERDTFGVDFSELPESNRKVTIVTIAFNNDKVLRHQINHIREHWHDSDIEYIVADNSPTVERQEAIRSVCEELNVSYMNIPKSPKINKISGSYSHGAAAMWVYYNYIVKRKPYIFGFIDHDLFPIKSFSMVEKMSDYSCYGYKMERGSAWYLWMGLIFLKSTFVNNFDINFHYFQKILSLFRKKRGIFRYIPCPCTAFSDNGAVSQALLCARTLQAPCPASACSVALPSHCRKARSLSARPLLRSRLSQAGYCRACPRKDISLRRAPPLCSTPRTPRPRGYPRSRV